MLKFTKKLFKCHCSGSSPSNFIFCFLYTTFPFMHLQLIANMVPFEQRDIQISRFFIGLRYHSKVHACAPAVGQHTDVVPTRSHWKLVLQEDVADVPAEQYCHVGPASVPAAVVSVYCGGPRRQAKKSKVHRRDCHIEKHEGSSAYSACSSSNIVAGWENCLHFRPGRGRWTRCTSA